MLSAPVIIPATMQATFPAASNPAPPGRVSLLVTWVSSPARRANLIAGSSPAAPIRFGSSKLAATVGIWDSCISRVALFSGSWRSQQPPFFQIRGHPPQCDTPNQTIHAVDPGSAADRTGSR